jgi:DNA-binding response OmpR family regulator
MNMGSKLTRLFHKELSQTPPPPQAVDDEFSFRDVIQSGDFRVDIGNRTATIDGAPLDLTSDEFDVLLFLVNHQQHVVTPHTVLTTGRTHSRHAEFLRVILSLRKKLEAAAPGKHYLRTEPWVVYRFDPAPSSPM